MQNMGGTAHQHSTQRDYRIMSVPNPHEKAVYECYME